MVAVHPHVRRADKLCQVELLPCRGSPPRVWGRHSAGTVCGSQPRFTPTCVGQTSKRPPSLPLMTGSPPRAWGRRSQCTIRCWMCGSPPTCVGQTWRTRLRTTASPVHPHVRGADGVVVVHRVQRVGSPPRAWGRRHLHAPPFRASGSPPRAWGRRLRLSVRLSGPRFTPTRVGQTFAKSIGLTRSAVHPHACGADRIVEEMTRIALGSPPRVWGRQINERVTAIIPRFTPTRVGQTFCRAARPFAPPVHPHACGADAEPDGIFDNLLGSPPRVWGRPCPMSTPSRSPRFTPTRVGQTPGCAGCTAA